MAAGLLEIDPQAFQEGFGREPLGVRHTLADHPLLTLDAIAELADSLSLRSIERHSANLPVVMPGGADPVSGKPSETVRNIEHNGCWMVLWYIEQSPAYANLLRECLDDVKPYLPPHVGGMQREEAFLFLSAPEAVTPVHFDPEHNFLLQIRGRKEMNVCKFENRDAELAELDRYFDGGHRNLDAMPSGQKTFRLDPGDGVYVPSFMPHWVQNGDQVSVSLSITFRTRLSERAERVHALNARLRRLHLEPGPPGKSAVADHTKEIAYVTFFGWRSRLGRLRRQLAGRRHAAAPTAAERQSA
jgi:hypothetical protein